MKTPTTPENQPSRNVSVSPALQSIPQAIVSPTQKTVQALGVFITISTPRDAYTETHFMKRWLSSIPPRFGTNKALDDAVRCLVNHCIGKLSNQDKVIQYARRAYGSALVNLQQAISDPEEGMSSETLCTTMVLSLYETYACTKKHAWVKHAGGATRLMQIRGPSRHKHDFDKMMLFAFRGVMIMEAFMQRTSCVLDTDEWRFVLAGPDAPSPLLQLTSEFYAYFATMPGMVQQLSNLQREDINQVVSFVNSASQLSSRLRDWFLRWRSIMGPGIEVPSATNDSTFPLVYDYNTSGGTNVFFATSYYGCMILLNNFIKIFQPDPNIEDDNQFMIGEICKNVEYSHQAGLFGPYNTVFGLRMAFMVAPLAVKMWIKDALDKMAEIMPIMRFQVKFGEDVVLIED